MIEIIGEAVDAHRPGLRRVAAREVIKLEDIALAMENMDGLAVVLMFTQLEKRLADASVYFQQELLSAPEPYPTEGIVFAALVHLVRIEEPALGWGWIPGQLRALGLTMNQGEELAWLTQEWAEISDREGSRRRFYRFSS